MVCAMQELATAAIAAGTEHQQQHHLQQQQQQQQQQQHQLQLQQQHFNHPPSMQQQQQSQQMTTIVLLTTTTPAAAATAIGNNNVNMNNTLQSIAINRLPPPPATATKSQQLKQQHSALVKLLESAPLAKKSVVNQLASPAPVRKLSQQQERHVVYVQQQQQQQQQPQAQQQQQPQQRKRLKNNNMTTTTQLLLLPSNTAIVVDERHIAQNIIKSATPATTIQPSTATNPNTAATITTTHSIINPAQRIKVEGDNMQEKKNSETTVEEYVVSNNMNDNESAKKTLTSLETITATNKPVNKQDEAGNYEQYQCPWKKIRYAREWKQRELQQQQTQHDIEQHSTQDQMHTVEMSNVQQDQHQQQGAKHHDHALSEQTHKEIAALLMQQQQQHQQQLRRDSSDSNCSFISNSSTQSVTQGLSHGCTCTPQQLKEQQSDVSGDDEQQDCVRRQRRLSQQACNCTDCQQQDMDSGCDDELCAEHYQQSLLEQSTMNYLCQKFDQNCGTAANGANKSNENNNDDQGDKMSEVKTEFQNNADMQSNDAVAATENEVCRKGFFRRSIQQKIQYRPCTKNQQCSILRINRNRCQYCRLKKCIAVGMSRDAVRFGRVPKREKARILAAMQQSTQNRGQQRALATELDDQPRLLAAVLRAHLDTCEFTKEKVAAMRQRARECPSYSMPTLLACPLNPAPELQSEQEFSQRFAHVIRGVIDFAGMIPGFQLLTQDDKFTLLKAGLFDALFVRLICMFDSSINSIICLNGQVMRRDAIQNGANARFLVDSTFNFAERMNSMNLSDAEIGLFCAIVLITPDRPGLRNIELIEKMYSRLKGCLQTIINQNRPDQPEFMVKLLETMPDLRTLSTLHTEKLVVFRTEHKELLRQQMWTMDDEQPPSSKSPGSSWDDARMDVEAKSPLGSVSSTESGDMEYTTSSTTPSTHHHHHYEHQPSALASSAPLLAATLSGTCPLRNRANSGSSGDSAADLDIVGSHAHLTQNGLTITPIVRSHSHQQLHHHLTSGTQHRYRKLDSPTDSGIESGNEKNECKPVSSGGSSSCSSPRSSVDDALDCTDAAAASTSQVTVSVSPVRSPQLHNNTAPTSTSMSSSPSTLKRQIVEDMPVLKRVLQAPPLYDTNSLMDEAYKPHKKFRALRHREYETAEADASSTSNGIGGTVSAPASSPVHSSQSAAASPQPAHVASSLSLPKTSPSPPNSPQPPTVQAPHNQSQLHMHLTRPTPTNINSHHQQQQQSSLSSTHSVLAKSLMAEPRMTPEQMKRSDIIQNYIMRDQTPASSTTPGLMVCTPTGPGSRSPAPPMNMHHAHHQQLYAINGSPSSSSSSNSNCASPSTTTVALASPPPPQVVAGSNATRWPGHSVITTTSIKRQQSVSPSSNGSSSSSSNSSTSSSSSGCQYFQSPHSTSASVSPPRPSPSSMNSPPRLLELQVDIADSQQPLNLSKKSPTPPPSKLQTLVAAASAAQRYPTVSADVTVTATNAVQANVSNGQSRNTQPMQVKVMLEA